MRIRPHRLSAVAAAVIGAALLAAPAPASAATAETTDQSCTITGGTLTWGLKESFRAYISGSIANGSWETTDGAAYETPSFIWSNGTGSYDPATGTGAVSFTGTVHFTGHDGVLDLTLANPTIEFEGDGAAALLLDARSTDMEGETAVDAQQEWVGEVDLGGAPAVADGAIALTDLPTVLTNSGAAAFAGFYEAGVELDPLNLDLAVADCDAPAEVVAAAEPAETPPAAPVADGSPDIPWAPIIVGGAALIVIGLTAGILIGGRRPRRSGADATSEPAATGEL